MAERPSIKNAIGPREWEMIKGSWLGHVPVFRQAGARPDPGLDDLPGLGQISAATQGRGIFQDVPGLRANLLSEAVFLFHKCAHSHLAAQRLGSMGMQSWSMFNAYHSAYLGARGLMALLGIGLVMLDVGGQFLIDIYPQPESEKEKRRLRAGSRKFDEFLFVRFGKQLDHHEVWEAFQRAIRVCDAACWNRDAYKELLDLAFKDISRPRNKFLYGSAFWPGDDLLLDGSADAFIALAAAGLDPSQHGFLLRLSFSVYRLFEQLIGDLAGYSGPIRDELDESRIIKAPFASDLFCYNSYLDGLEAAEATS